MGLDPEPLPFGTRVAGKEAKAKPLSQLARSAGRGVHRLLVDTVFFFKIGLKQQISMHEAMVQSEKR